MHSLSTIKTFIANAKAFLAEAKGEDSPKYRKLRALQAKRQLENAKLRLDRLIQANPGLTESSEDIKALRQQYNLYNLECMDIITISNPLSGYKQLFSVLERAEIDMAKAIDKVIAPQEAINSLNKAEMTIQSLERQSEEIPQTIIERLMVLRGYTDYI